MAIANNASAVMKRPDDRGDQRDERQRLREEEDTFGRTSREIAVESQARRVEFGGADIRGRRTQLVIARLAPIHPHRSTQDCGARFSTTARRLSKYNLKEKIQVRVRLRHGSRVNQRRSRGTTLKERA